MRGMTAGMPLAFQQHQPAVTAAVGSSGVGFTGEALSFLGLVQSVEQPLRSVDNHHLTG